MKFQFLIDLEFLRQIKICIQKISVSIFKFHLYPPVFGDHSFWGESYFGRIIIDHIILVFSPLQ